MEEIHAAYEFDGLQDFLDLYYAGMSVLIEERDFRDLTRAYLDKMAEQGAAHVEIFLDPQGHTDRGVAFETVLGGIMSGLEEGKKELGITSKLIMCFLRHLPEEEAFEALACACRYKEHIHAVGLDSGEAGNPPANFERVYEAARKEGFIAVAHAGEEGPAAYVTDALDILKVSPGRSRQPRAGRPEAGRPAGPRENTPDHVSAFKFAPEGHSLSGRTPDQTGARYRAARHGEFRRSILF